MKNLFTLLFFTACLAQGATVMVDNTGRLVYPEADEFIAANKIATLADISGGGGAGGGYPLVKIPMDAVLTKSGNSVIVHKPVEAELKVKEYRNPDAAYWFSTLRDANYDEYAKRDVGGQAWFTCPRPLLAFDDNRDYIPHLPAYWGNIADQLTDMTAGVHTAQYDDVCDVLVEPNVGGYFLDGTPIGDVWHIKNPQLKAVYARIGQAGAIGAWNIASVEWRAKKLEVPAVEGQVLTGTDFKSVEYSACFNFTENGVVYANPCEGEILFTSKNAVFNSYGKTIIAFTIEFPEFEGSASLRVGILNRHTATQSWTTSIADNSVPERPSGWHIFSLEVVFNGNRLFPQTSKDSHFEGAGEFVFDSEGYSGATVRVVAYAEPFDHQFTITREVREFYNIKYWSQTVKAGSPTYNILGVFSTGMPQGAKISNLKIITFH